MPAIKRETARLKSVNMQRHYIEPFEMENKMKSEDAVWRAMNGNANHTRIPPFLTDLLRGMVKRKPFVKKKREQGGFDFTSLRLDLVFLFFLFLGGGVGNLHFFS